MTGLLESTERQDLHNSSTNYEAARVGRCGFTHLASGRTCLLSHRHHGSCQLVSSTGNAALRDTSADRDGAHDA